jgi:hypothetical protein
MEAQTLVVVASLILAACCLALAFCLALRRARSQGQPLQGTSESEWALFRQAGVQGEQAIEGALSQQSSIARSGTPLDTSALAPRIQQVRQDYVAELHLRPRPARCEDRLVRSARQSVRTLLFFRRRTTDAAASTDPAHHEE